MNFRSGIHVIRRCEWTALTIISVIGSLVLFPCLKTRSISQRLCFGAYKIILLNVGDDAWEQWIARQKDVIIAAIKVMTSPDISPALTLLFERITIKTFLVMRGMPRHSTICNQIFLYLGPPSDDVIECTRCLLANIIWIQKRREEYFVNCRSKKTSRNMATNFMEQSLKEIQPLIVRQVTRITGV